VLTGMPPPREIRGKGLPLIDLAERDVCVVWMVSGITDWASGGDSLRGIYCLVKGWSCSPLECAARLLEM
jgi:hypothetical protein